MNAYELKLEARYGQCFHALHCALYGRISNWTYIFVFLGGSAVAYSFYSKNPTWSGGAGLAMVALKAVEAIIKPGERSVENKALSRRYGELLAAIPELSADEAEKQLVSLQNEFVPGEVKALQWIAWNMTMREAGHKNETVELTCWQRLIEALA